MNTVVHLRKLCNHPFLFENIEEDCRKFWKVPEITGFVAPRLCCQILILHENIFIFEFKVVFFHFQQRLISS